MNNNQNNDNVISINGRTQPAPTHIVVLLDRSGSMAPIANDVIGGFNQYLEEQQKDGSDARISIVLFDSQNPQETVMWACFTSGTTQPSKLSQTGKRRSEAPAPPSAR